jgi:RNA polymerase sigma-70 factor (ECF subfamily)
MASLNIDKETFSKFKKGEPSAFDDVFKHYRHVSFFTILSILKHQENAEDCFQDTWIKVFENHRSVKNVATLTSWILIISKRTALNYLKKRTDESWNESYDQVVATEDKASRIDTWHRQLSTIENTILAYKVVYQLTLEDIAKLEHMSPSQVYTLYQEALEKIRKDYEHE